VGPGPASDAHPRELSARHLLVRAVPGGDRAGVLGAGGPQDAPGLGIAGQFGLLAKPRGELSIADRWFSEVGASFTGVGALKANPDPKTYITDEYMKLAAGLAR
jgi:hypothetical protein